MAHVLELAIRLETDADAGAIAEVHRSAFGREDEARLVDALRRGGYARLSLVAENRGQIVGHILFSVLPITTARCTIDALSLAPLAVMPSHQRLGVGAALIL